jgi:hypothetical protein
MLLQFLIYLVHLVILFLHNIYQYMFFNPLTSKLIIHVYILQESGTREQYHDIHYGTLQQPQGSIDSEEVSHGQVSSTADSKETDSNSKTCFSFAQKPSEGAMLQQDIQQYIKKFEKNVSKLPTMRSSYGELRDYSFQTSAESLLFDRVILKNRIDSGRFLLCGGGNFWSS